MTATTNAPATAKRTRTKAATPVTPVTPTATDPATDGTPMERLVAKYRDADRIGKAKLRKKVNKDMLDAITSGNLEDAMANKAILDQFVRNSARESVPTDPRALLKVRITALRRAADYLESGSHAPAPTGDETPLDVTTMALGDYALTDEDEVAIEDQAVRFATARLTGTGRRNSLTDHIIQAVSDLGAEGNVVTIRSIAGYRSNSLPEGAPSDGAIAARLFPVDKNGLPRVCTVPGVVPVDSVPGIHPRGARLEEV